MVRSFKYRSFTIKLVLTESYGLSGIVRDLSNP